MIVIYHEERRRFEAITSYFERQIPKAERWHWDNTVARWYATEESVARRLVRYAQGNAALRLTALSEAEKQALADSQARDLAPDLEVEIPAPPGLAASISKICQTITRVPRKVSLPWQISGSAIIYLLIVIEAI